jgi:D-citramalate synthase
MKISIMDTTLRDGEQTAGVTFNHEDKLLIAKMLIEEVLVDRIEVASARVSKGEFEAVKKITNWAKKNNHLEKIEILAFIDDGKSLQWIKQAGGRVVNLLCKGSLKHVSVQLRKTPQRHLDDIKKTINKAKQFQMKVNLYLEDWSNGIKNSPDYLFFLVNGLKNEKIKRFMLPDTLGILHPEETFNYCQLMVKKFPKLQFDFHAHNDYDLAVANSLSAVKAGCSAIHTTINGLGERAGNASLSSVHVVLKDHLNVELKLDETKLNKVSKFIEELTKIKIPSNTPITGDNVFTQCCGVHADGDNKGNLYYNRLTPQRFGRTRKYALGKTSGKASIQKNLNKLGIDLDLKSVKKLTAKVVELGDQQQQVEAEDLPLLISELFGKHVLEKNKNCLIPDQEV